MITEGDSLRIGRCVACGRCHVLRITRTGARHLMGRPNTCGDCGETEFTVVPSERPAAEARGPVEPERTAAGGISGTRGTHETEEVDGT